MRDDLSAVNIGQAEETYKRDFFWRSYRDIEMFMTRILSKGPVEVSSLTADTATVQNSITLGSVTWTSDAGTPEGAVVATVGSLYTRTDGGASTTLYVKTSGTGNTGWTAK